MASLRITDIRRNCCDSGSDLVNAIFLNKEVCDSEKLNPLIGILILESATAGQTNPEIGVHRGEQYVRMRAKPGHG